MDNSPAIDQAMDLLRGVATLPVVPEVAKQVIESFSNDWVELDDVNDIISLDPALSAKIVGLANSAFYGSRVEILTVRDAIFRILGLDVARGVAIGLSCAESFDFRRCPNLDAGQFWAGALAKSDIAKRLLGSYQDVAHQSAELEDLAATITLCGLLSDIGLLGFLVIDPSRTSRALSDAEDSPSFTDLFGCEVADMSAALATHWELPTSVCSTLSDYAQLGTTNPPTALSVCTLHWLVNQIYENRFEDLSEQSDVCSVRAVFGLPDDLSFLGMERIIESSEAMAGAFA